MKRGRLGIVFLFLAVNLLLLPACAAPVLPPQSATATIAAATRPPSPAPPSATAPPPTATRTLTPTQAITATPAPPTFTPTPVTLYPYPRFPDTKLEDTGVCPGFTGYGDYGGLASGALIWPVDNPRIGGFPYEKGFHDGIDLTAAEGDNVYAADSGVVIYSGWVDFGYGEAILLDHGNGMQTLYGHLSAILVPCWHVAHQGDVIGLAGSSGNSSAAHLHFEVRFNRVYLHPLDVLPELFGN
jgi:murein DD-endopeptidase MepM/ murein hydrolase activator NlpD